MECDDITTIPTCILACGDVWRIKYSGAPAVCLMCGDASHQIKDCTAVKREEAVVQQWDVSMRSNVEVFFPTKRQNGMTEDIFNEEQKKNVNRERQRCPWKGDGKP